ncbi:MAG: hypothetical protein ABIF85_04045 [Nanoarchaeota archaeon]|nr:hypothetical protein [Nanoarchaeota archaeon]MBU4301052.1 hypothetical protein [Nanoarchaeota archaeon]MBU4452278.1 hypothetical protein [Nanoarchaeota archaeon]MCG2724044.1 hypothetical protein [archaeon]
MPLTSHTNSKAQSSIELLLFFSIALLMFSVVCSTIFEKTRNVYDSKSISQAIEISEKIAAEINTAISEGDGYSKNITLQNDIFGATYIVSVDKGNVFVVWRGKNAASRTIIENVTGTFVSGNNRIKNKGGFIIVN